MSHYPRRHHNSPLAMWTHLEDGSILSTQVLFASIRSAFQQGAQHVEGAEGSAACAPTSAQSSSVPHTLELTKRPPFCESGLYDDNDEPLAVDSYQED
eukprot:4187180-Amphidinium_carterae.1